MQNANSFVNHYEVLGLPNSATIEQIEKAHRYQARIYHPDKNSSKEARGKFEEIQTSYEALKDPIKKKAYDNILAAKLEDIKRYEMQDRAKRKMADDLLRREEENAKSKIKEQQKAYRDQYEAKVARMRQVEELIAESRQSQKKSSQHFTVLVKWRHKSKLLHTRENLKQIFVQYGRVDDIVPVEGKHRAFVVFAHKESVSKLLEDREKFAGDFKIKAVKEADKREDEGAGCFLSTHVINKIRMANEKKSFNTIKEEDGETQNKKRKIELINPMDPEEFRRKEEEILRKLME